MRTIVAALAIVVIATAGFVVSREMYKGRAAGGDTAASTPAGAQGPSAQGLAPDAGTSQTPPPQGAVPEESNSAGQRSPGSIDRQAVQSALSVLLQHGGQSDSSPQQQGTPSAVAPGADRYPGSQPLKVDEGTLPDIGVPVASEVYTTPDSLATVVAYYRQRYPEAELTEINGQQVIAITHPTLKVIAIGTTGSETRIAIVQPAN